MARSNMTQHHRGLLGKLGNDPLKLQTASAFWAERLSVMDHLSVGGEILAKCLDGMVVLREH